MLIDRIKELFNSEVIKTYTDFSENNKAALEYWINSKYSNREVIPYSERNFFNQYDDDIKTFRSLGTISSLSKLSYRQKKFISERADVIKTLYEKYIKYKTVDEKIDSLIALYPLAIQYYYAKNYGIALDGNEAVIARGKYKTEVRFPDFGYSYACRTHITSLKNVIFDTKAAICNIDSHKLKDLQDELDNKVTSIITQKEREYIDNSFREKVIKNERRKKYYKDFCAQTAPKENIQEYCINHLKDLDNFIAKKLEMEYKVLKKNYPKGIEYYDAMNDFQEGDHLSGIDYWEDCVNKIDLIIRQHEIGVEYDKLYTKYPNGIEGYRDSHQIVDDNLCCVFVPSKEEIVSLGENKLHELELLSKTIKRNNQWIKDQSDFANRCRSLHDKYFENWGCYCYDLVIDTPSYHDNPSRKDYRIWQHFCDSYCSDMSLNYVYNPKQKEEYEKNIPGLKNLKLQYKTRVYDRITEYIKRIKEEYGEVLVLLGNSGIEDSEFKKYHYLYLVKKLTELSIFYGTKIINPQHPYLYKYIVFVEVISSNEHMKKQCMDVISQFQEYCPHITYISLEKELDHKEMSKYIDSTIQKKEKERQEEEERQERIRKEKERKRLLEEKREKDKCQLMRCVSSWQEPSWANLRCYSLYYYYPVTCEWDANEDEWYIRNLIWDFKANPNKPQSEIEIQTRHQNAARKVLVDLKKCLQHYFGNNLSKLTFVCIPSSKALVTERRYKDFSTMVCNELGMENAYDHIYVSQDGEAKHIGGTIQATYSLDKEYFKNKFVILFDDVITSGKSMEKFRNMIVQAGAYVICGISIGKTKHERQPANPIDLLGNGCQTSEDTYDLPF